MTSNKTNFIRLNILIGTAVFFLAVTQSGCAYQIIQSGKVNTDRLKAIETRVACFRGLPFKRPLDYVICDETQTKKILLELIQRDFPKEKWDVWQRFFRRVDAIPKDVDLHAQFLDLLFEQASGFYDPISKKLYISSRPLPLGFLIPLMQFFMQRDLVNEFILSHEIIHALQDQHFGLEKTQKKKKDQFDECLAMHALVEGDALLGTLVTLTGNPEQTGALKDMGKQIQQEAPMSSQAFKKAPPVLREYLIFPYYGGLDFVQAYVDKASWQSVDNLYKKPPVSSEQILHPSKYFAGDIPAVISMNEYRNTLGGSWKILEENTLGEAFMGIVFDKKSVVGWGGDRFVLAQAADKPQDEVLVWETRWDSDQDAARFLQGASAWQDRRKVQVLVDKPAGETSAPAFLRIAVSGTQWEVLDGQGDRARLIQTPSEAVARQLLPQYRRWFDDATNKRYNAAMVGAAKLEENKQP